MLGRIDGAAHRQNVRSHAGGGFVVHDANRLDAMLAVGAQPRLDEIGLYPPPPARRRRQFRILALPRNEFAGYAQARRHLLPERREVAGLVHQHVIAGTQGIGQSGFPGAGAGSGINNDGVPGLEYLLDTTEDFEAERREFRTAMIDGRQTHRAQNAVGDRTRTWNLQEMPPARMKIKLDHGSPRLAYNIQSEITTQPPLLRRNKKLI